MPKYLIEREVPNAGSLNTGDLSALAQRSCSVLRELGPEIEWIQSYVTGNKIYCLYVAPNEALILEHARKGGFPASSISEVSAVIGPAKI